MRTAILISSLLLVFGYLQGQHRYAKFLARLGHVDHHLEKDAEFHEELMEMTWKIHGQVLQYEGDTVAIAVDDKIDTIFFQLRRDRDWDTLICNINEPRTYIFEYNTCCNYFDVHDPSRKPDRIQGLVSFQVLHGKEGIRYLGNLDDAGGMVVGKAPTVVSAFYCRSPMFPNNYNVLISEVIDCTDSAACNGTLCLFQPGDPQPGYDFALETTRELLHFRYLPLSPEPLQVIWNDKKERLQLKGPFPAKVPRQ